MGLFPGFGAWINQQPHNAESGRSDDAKSKSVSDAKKLKELNLWNDTEKKNPWYDAPPRVKVTTNNGICHMKIELTVGLPPDGVFEIFTNPNNAPLFNIGGRELLENKSRKVLKKDGPREIAKVKKSVAWDFLWLSGAFPFNLIVDENKKDLTAKYKKDQMMFMKVFEGNWKVEPMFVDQERLCKHDLPKSVEEYKKCSGGQGKIASKVTMDQYFQPYALLDWPPFSWYIRETTIKTTKTLLKLLQYKSAIFREVS